MVYKYLFYQPFWHSILLEGFSGDGLFELLFELSSSLTNLIKNIANAPTMGGMPAKKKGRS